ncbi:8-oxo-dGTP diphosphatase MutT [Algoriphagus jejuensis]|uniref:8-oxo-dGTP diphosphatase n=1 Tax=Algoriphagus jejuensis TaxID=419934 RepID=A0ABP3YH69_9BACT
MKIIPVTCALIIHQGKVLAAQRSETMDLPGKWEFPGGKVEAGENPETCLIREIREELGIEIEVVEQLPVSDYSYPTKTIRLIPFSVFWKSGEIHLLEHSRFAWLDKNNLISMDWAAADLPTVRYLHDNWVTLVIQTNR